MSDELITACKDGDLQKVKFLVEKGADIHARTDSPLWWAVYNGHLDILKFLVEKGVNIHSCLNTSLRRAAENGYLDMVIFLAEKGADICTYDDALRWTVISGHLNIVKYLVEHGANIHVCDNAPLRIAAEIKQLDIVTYLRQVAGKKWKCHDCIVKVTCLNLCEGWWNRK